MCPDPVIVPPWTMRRACGPNEWNRGDVADEDGIVPNDIVE